MNERPAGKKFALNAIAVLAFVGSIYVAYSVITADVAEERQKDEALRQLVESNNENLELLDRTEVTTDEGDSPETQAGD